MAVAPRPVAFRRISNPRNIEAGLWDDFDEVYASTIFDWTKPIAQRLLEVYPHAVIGGPGWSRSVGLEAIGVKLPSVKFPKSSVCKQKKSTDTIETFSLFPHSCLT